MTVVKDDPPVRAAIYARVSSDQQSKEGTIASQIEALRQRVQADGLNLEEGLCFIDDGFTGSSQLRPALDRLRDAAYAGDIDRLYMLEPDRLARKYAHQAVLVEEFQRHGIDMVFLNHAMGEGPEAELFLQIKGMIAEYERALIIERTRRGKRHAAQRGCVEVLGAAPYGYRYLSKQATGGQACYQVVPEEAAIVRKMFTWVGRDRLSLQAVSRRLRDEGIVTRTGKRVWNPSTIMRMLTNPAYRGQALYGKRCRGERLPRLRPRRGQSDGDGLPYSTFRTAPSEHVSIPVPALVGEDLFAAVQEQLAENKKRYRLPAQGARYLLQGLLVCQECGYSYCGRRVAGSSRYYRCTGTDRQRFGGQRVCWSKMVRCDLLDQAVWTDVGALLRDPTRIRQEYERRMSQPQQSSHGGTEEIKKLVQKVKRAIARLIDAYESGLLTKSEFEPRIQSAKQRVAHLEVELKTQTNQEAQRQELRLVYGDWEEFAKSVEQGLRQPDFSTKQGIIRALVKRVEIDPQAVRIIYKVSPLHPTDSNRHAKVQDRCSRDHLIR